MAFDWCDVHRSISCRQSTIPLEIVATAQTIKIVSNSTAGNHSKAHWWPQPLFNISSFSDHHCQGVVSNSLAGALRHNLVTRSTWGVTVSNLTAAFSPRTASHQLVTRVNRVIASSATISSSREFLLRGMFPELSAYLLSISCACFQMFTR